MRISYITTDFDLQKGGGSNYSLHQLAERMAQNNHDVDIIAKSFAPNENQDYSYNVNELGSVNTLRYLNERDDNTDIYHIFSTKLMQVAGLYKYLGDNSTVIGRLNSYPFCTNFGKMDGECHKNCNYKKKFRHSEKKIGKNILLSPYYIMQDMVDAQLFNSIDHLFAQSPSIKKIYRDVGVNNENMSVVPNFYDPDFELKNGSDNKDGTMVLYVGKITKRKGVDILLNSFEKLVREGYNIQLDIVGDGEERIKLEKMTNNNVLLKQSVTFHGWVNHKYLPEYYSNADIFVHPGRWPEPFGNTILEAMQNYCVPVVSNIGGPPWVAGDAGHTFVRGDTTSLSRTIKNIIDNQELEESKGLARDRVNYFNPDKVCREIENKYNEIRYSDDNC